MTYVMCRPTLTTLIAIALTLPCAISTVPARALSDARLDAAAKGIETRREALLAKVAGMPFKTARKQEPLGPGRGLFVRSYGYSWQAEESKTFSKGGEWLTLKDAYAPVIMEVARKGDFKDYAAFQEKVQANPMRFEKRVLEYTGLAGDKFTFYADYRGMPRIDGQPVELKTAKAFDSPFIQSALGSGVVTIKNDGRTAVLDFN